MTTRAATYCNTTTDLWEIDPNVEVHDQKREILGWVQSSGSLYYADNVGYVSVLFADEEDLGAPEATLVATDANKEWFYDADIDRVYCYLTAGVDGVFLQGGEDWATLKTRVVQRASEVVRSFVNRPIPRRSGTGQQTADSRDYDWVITHSTAAIAVSLLMRDKSAAMEVRKIAINPSWPDEVGESPGWLDLIKDGSIKLWNEIGIAEIEGDVRTVTVNDATTGTILDTRIGSGGISTAWDVIKVIIVTGGTVTEGTLNETVTFSTYISSGTMIKYTTVQSAAYIQLDYQHVGHNLYIRFAPGVYTANDEWEIEVSNMPEDHGKISSIDLERA